MGRQNEATELTASEVAVQARMSRERVVRMIQIGVLKGRRDAERGWVVSEKAAREFHESQRRRK